MDYCIAGYFRGVHISRIANSILVREKYISRMEILNHASSHIQDFYFRGLAVLSRNSRNINASKITRSTVVHNYTDLQISQLIKEGGLKHSMYIQQLVEDKVHKSKLYKFIKCGLKSPH